MLAVGKQNQRALALLAVASLLTIAPSASQSPQPAAAASAAVAQPAAIPVTSAPAFVPLALSSSRPAPVGLTASLQTVVRASAGANMLDTPSQPQQRQQQLPSAAAAASANSATEERVQWPMVEVERQRNKSTVDVHVPAIFDMVNHNDDETGKSKLDLSVLQGLVTVNRDKERDQNGRLTGPLKVTVFGIPVYTGRGLAPQAPAPVSAATATGPYAAAQRDLDNTVILVNKTLTRKAEDIVAQVADNTRRANDRMLRSLSDILEKFSSVMRATTNRVSSTSSSLMSAQQQEEKQQQLKQQQQQQDKLNKLALEKMSENQLMAQARVSSNKPLVTLERERASPLVKRSQVT